MKISTLRQNAENIRIQGKEFDIINQGESNVKLFFNNSNDSIELQPRESFSRQNGPYDFQLNVEFDGGKGLLKIVI